MEARSTRTPGPIVEEIVTDLTYLPFAAGAGFDDPLDPGQMRWQMATVALGFTGRFRPRAPQSRLGLFLRGLEHPLGQFGVFQRQVELVWRQLLGAFAELLALRGAQNILQPTIGLVRFGQRCLDLGQAGFQQGVFVGESVGIHGSK